MRALVVDGFGGPERLVPRDVPASEPGPGEVAVAVEYAGVGFVDMLFRCGEFASTLAHEDRPARAVIARQRQPSSGARWVSTLEITCAL